MRSPFYAAHIHPRCLPRRETFEHLPDWLAQIRPIAGENMSVILLGCKKDLEAQRAVTRDEGSKFAEANGASQRLSSLPYTPSGFGFFEVSAKTFVAPLSGVTLTHITFP